MTEVEKDFGVLESFNFTPKTKTEINKIIDSVLQDLTLSHEDFIFKRLQKIYIRK